MYKVRVEDYQIKAGNDCILNLQERPLGIYEYQKNIIVTFANAIIIWGEGFLNSFDTSVPLGYFHPISSNQFISVHTLTNNGSRKLTNCYSLLVLQMRNIRSEYGGPIKEAIKAKN